MNDEHLPSTISQSSFSPLDQIDRWCLDFEANWTPVRFSEFWERLPALDDQNRALLFQFMLRIDQEQRNSAGLPVTDEYYLKSFPVDYPEYLRQRTKSDPVSDLETQSEWLTPNANSSTTMAHTPVSNPNFPKIAGYSITKRLGGGGMGEVWQGMQLSANRPVAIKLIRDDFQKLDEAQRRFRREIELAANLDHPNIARIYDARIDLQPAYYAMEYVEGETFDSYLKNPQRTFPQAIEVYQQACEGVAYAHQQHILHRDLKPANIMVDQQGRTKIIDFGIAKALHKNAEELTLTGGRLGTPDYMAPEQDSGRSSEATQASDIYSLGVILQRILARFYDDSRKQPAKLKAIVARATNKDSSLRPQSVSEILAALPKRSASNWSSMPTPFRLGMGAFVVLAILFCFISLLMIKSYLHTIIQLLK